MIAIQLNKERLEFPEGTTLAGLVAALDKLAAGLGTALNGGFVARGLGVQCGGNDGDVVMTFEPITGG